MFINRVAELQLLEKRYASHQAEFFILYGRRRVGKTELLSRFCEGKKHIFFVADLSSETMLRASLSAALNAVLFGQDQLNAVYSTWEDLIGAMAWAAENERLVVVLDEFPYLISAYPPLASILQRLWDQVLRKTQIMLIVSGSYIGMMEEMLLGYQAPLYGRRTAQYLLEPLDYYSAREFCRSYSPEDQVRAYAVYGGTPAYLQRIQPAESLQVNIREGILEKGSFLYDEVRFLLQQELREPRNYYAALQAIAAGKTRLNEIKQATGLDNIISYLDTLQQLHLLERVVPVTETQPHKSRRGIYRVKDHYLRFWFRFLLPNRSRLELGESKLVLDTQVTPQLDLFTGPVFEDVCRQFLWRAGAEGRLPFRPLQVGGWWNASEEIDLIALGEAEAMLVECKWASRPVGTDILENLEHKARLVRDELVGRQVFYGLCARSGFTPALKELAAGRGDVLLLSFDEMD